MKSIETYILNNPKIDAGETDRCPGQCSYGCEHTHGYPLEPDPDDYENKNPLARSYELAADCSFSAFGFIDGSLVETCQDEFYRNKSPYGLATLTEVEFDYE